MAYVFRQFHFPYIDVSRYECDKSALRFISGKICLRYHVIPLCIIIDVLTVATADRHDVEFRDYLNSLTGCKVFFVISDRDKIETAIQECYGDIKG